MNRSTGVPTPEQARRARDHVFAQAAAEGRRPSVLAVAHQLGMTNTTFRRHFPDLAKEIGDARRQPEANAETETSTSSYDKLLARNAKLRRNNRQLRDHLQLAVANIQRLTLQVHRQQQALEAASQVTHISTKTR